MEQMGNPRLRSDLRMLTAMKDRTVVARRVAVASAIGTTIEWYDFFIYGTAAATVLAPQFFPQISSLAGMLASFATFVALSFISWLCALGLKETFDTSL
jgi:hypothetical protein